jgi:hypothetical protein
MIDEHSENAVESPFANKLLLAFVLEQAMTGLMLWLCEQPDEFDKILVPHLKKTPRRRQNAESKNFPEANAEPLFYLRHFEEAMSNTLKIERRGAGHSSWTSMFEAWSSVRELKIRFRNPLAHGRQPMLSDAQAAADIAELFRQTREWIKARHKDLSLRPISFDAWRLFRLGRDDLTDILNIGRIEPRPVCISRRKLKFYRDSTQTPARWICSETVNSNDFERDYLTKKIREAWPNFETCEAPEIDIGYSYYWPKVLEDDFIGAPYWQGPAMRDDYISVSVQCLR